MSSPKNATWELLGALAIATTVYHEAAPDTVEEARHRYVVALDRFRSAQPQPKSEFGALESVPGRTHTLTGSSD